MLPFKSKNSNNTYLKKIKEIQKDFCLATGLKSIIIDKNNDIISEYNTSNTFCTRFFSLKAEKNCICNRCSSKKLDIYTTNIHDGCYFPFWSCAVDVKLGKSIIAKIFVGEVLEHKLNDSELSVIANESGLCFNHIKGNIERILIYSDQQKNGVVSFLAKVSKLISHHYEETEEYEKKVMMLKVVDEIAKNINSPSDLSAIFEAIADKTSELINYDTFCILLLDHNNEEFDAVYARGIGKQILEQSIFKIGEGYAGYVLKKNIELIIGDARINNPIPIKYNKLIEEGLRSFLVVPLKIENKRIGCFIIASQELNKYTDMEADVIKSIACWAAIAINKNDLLTKRGKMLEDKEEILGHYLPHTLKSPLGLFRLKFLENVTNEQRDLFDMSVEFYDEVIINAKYYFEFDEFQNFEPVFGLLNILHILDHIKEKRLRGHINAKNINLIIKNELLNTTNTYIWGDYNKLLCAFINLISNAIKFGNQNDTITINLKGKTKSLVIEIIDQGSGISDTDKKYVFEPFERGKNARTIHGGGLGLFITHKIILAHKWSPLKFENNIDRGCKAILEIPYQCPHDILVVDDEEIYLQEIHNYLDEIKCNVKTATSISEAEMIILNDQRNSQGKIKLLIVDRMNNKAGLKAAKEWESKYNYEIIIISQRDISIKRELDGFTFIRKPFDKKHLIEIVNSKLH